MHTAFHIHSPPAPILCAHACTHMHTLVFTFHTCIPAETQGTTGEASPHPGAPQRREPDPGHFPRQQTPGAQVTQLLEIRLFDASTLWHSSNLQVATHTHRWLDLRHVQDPWRIGFDFKQTVSCPAGKNFIW